MELTVAGLDARTLDIPMKKAFGIAGGAQEVARNVLVRVTLTSGVEGWGEAAPLPAFNGETQASTMAALTELADRSAWSGIDMSNWRAAAERARDLPSAAARCAVETAILDAWCKAHRTTMFAVFGSKEAEL